MSGLAVIALGARARRAAEAACLDAVALQGELPDDASITRAWVRDQRRGLEDALRGRSHVLLAASHPAAREIATIARALRVEVAAIQVGSPTGRELYDLQKRSALLLSCEDLAAPGVGMRCAPEASPEQVAAAALRMLFRRLEAGEVPWTRGGAAECCLGSAGTARGALEAAIASRRWHPWPLAWARTVALDCDARTDTEALVARLNDVAPRAAVRADVFGGNGPQVHVSLFATDFEDYSRHALGVARMP